MFTMIRKPMRARTFYGGVHPPENKHWTEHAAIEEMPLPRKVIIPLQQHTGAPAEPIVREGDQVQAGQKIGESAGFVSSPVHASISGKVTAIQPLPHPVLPMLVRAVVIEGDGSAPDGQWPNRDWSRLSAGELRDLVRDAGVVGLGGAAFPTHVKLSPPPEKKIDALIVNGVECEPYLTADHRLMIEGAEGILEGVRIILKILGLSHAYIGIEGHYIIVALSPFRQYLVIINETL